jgi:hypothetical protein
MNRLKAENMYLEVLLWLAVVTIILNEVLR